MSDSPFDAWRQWALPFADPKHAPDWQPEDRPAWPGINPSQTFRAWVRDRLVELERRIFADRFGPEPPTPEQVMSRALRGMGPEALALFGFLFERARDEHDDPEEMLRHMLRSIEPKRRGPTATPELRSLEPKGMAGWDIWMMRKIILPRFWPEAAASSFHLHKDELARIAADRRGCTAQQALRFYTEERLASR